MIGASEQDPAVPPPRDLRHTVLPEESRTRVTRGPLLAVCGLCGGAGASTLAYLVALAEARRHSDSVLVADTGGPSGGVARYAGVEAPRSLTEVATQVVAGLPAGQLVATTEAGCGCSRPARGSRPSARARGSSCCSITPASATR